MLDDDRWKAVTTVGYPPRERAAAAHGDAQPVMLLQVRAKGSRISR